VLRFSLPARAKTVQKKINNFYENSK